MKFLHKERDSESTVFLMKSGDLPPKYVPIFMLVLPAGIEKVEARMLQVQAGDSPGSCGA